MGKSGGPLDWMTFILPSTSLSRGRPSFPPASTEITIRGMTIAAHRALRADIQAAIDTQPRRSGGPRTTEGKARSSLNALRHGLGAIQAILPGESLDLYEIRADAFFAAHGVNSSAAAEIAALAFDDLWRLERSSKVETALILGRIEELTAQTELAKLAAATGEAIVELGGALETWATEPAPTRKDGELSRRIKIMRSALDLVTDLLPDLALEPFAAVDLLLTRACDSASGRDLPDGLHREVQDKVREILISLMARGDAEEAQQEEIRIAVAALALPAEHELRKLARYRKSLEEGLLRRLQALELTKKLTADRPAAEHDLGAAREFRLQLRIAR